MRHRNRSAVAAVFGGVADGMHLSGTHPEDCRKAMLRRKKNHAEEEEGAFAVSGARGCGTQHPRHLASKSLHVGLWVYNVSTGGRCMCNAACVANSANPD